MLTGDEILHQYKKGAILIDPFDEKHLNPNSYNLTLSPNIAWYERPGNEPLSMKKDNPVVRYKIPEQGILLLPGRLYLCMTNEQCGSDLFVSCIEGRSSVARLGMSVHLTAGFGDLGFKSFWTLEVTVVEPLIAYANIPICQAAFHEVCGPINDRLYRGKYVHQPVPKASGLWKDFVQDPTK